ncbi:MAG: enoyl-CoA hydratase/isomerase family protein [Alphaproteobacteria bacterium]|jgi:enoyl-CoA hydratase|nr:enoyl-CoA hydratase/isomerase family protein [Alphaproteobacteria bacterium]MDP6814815.1 enoyl-CoA hydratase/isomerase family protein [Alphaproteobacteria bacterium]
MTYETIKCETKDQVLRLTLNRPDVLNALSAKTLHEIHDVARAADEDDAVRVILIDSASDRAFSAGIDVAYVKDMDAFGSRGMGQLLHRTFLALRTITKPVVTEIDGLCLGAGLELALSCDFMIASERSRFGLPNIHRGIPAIVEAALLPIAVGIQGTRELCYLGEFWDAEKAERRGLVQQVHPADELSAAVDELCRTLASKSPFALESQKEIIHKWLTTDLESAIDFSINTVGYSWLTKDQQEGMDAFVEKRPASFKGE